MEAHAAWLRAASGDAALAEAVKRDYRTAPVEAKTRALLDFAWKVTKEQWECRAGDIEGLRTAGWSDEAVVDTVGIIGFFNFITRVADALGVELNAEYATLGNVDFSSVTQSG